MSWKYKRRVIPVATRCKLKASVNVKSTFVLRQVLKKNKNPANFSFVLSLINTREAEMMNLYEHVKQLHESELFQDLIKLGSIVITLCDNNPDIEILTLAQRFQCMVLWGDALYNTKEYLRAEDVYQRSLILKKALGRSKVKGPGLGAQPAMEVTSEVDVKFKIYQCLIEMKQYKEGMLMLEGITSRQRNSKINLALAKLYIRAGMDRSAITSYKEVIRVCPLALDAIQGLLSLGVKGGDVSTLVMNGLPLATFDWLAQWIKGQAFLTSREFSNAVTTFTAMDKKIYLKDNAHLVNSLGEALFYDGQYDRAEKAFQRVQALDAIQLKNMDLYSFLLAKNKNVKELQKLSHHLMNVTENAPEPWIVIGYFSLLKESRTRAVYFAQKANNMDSFNIEAYLLKGQALLELKKSQDASLHFIEAIRLAPHRYEAYLGLINCYMASHRTREALSWAGKAIKILGSSARTLTLYAYVLSKEPLMTAKAKPYLEKAMKVDPNYLEPIYIMAEILAREQQHEKAIELLRKQLATHSTYKLHEMLAESLSQTNEHLEALDQYSIALSLDPNNAKAREGMERLEKQSDLGLESSYDVDVDEMEMEGSDNEEVFDGSDLESTWSEPDYIT